ncbi:hypothetical protein [Microbacterium sp. CCH5-D1]|uniref:hypothetical protein n=1 Tax=Microbacterium sp. CCH5-D1 TaxID=1768780 RepID=UPI00076A0B31|nr:hypothetical protein [Microbacterium sp. CCH5-D1]
MTDEPQPELRWAPIEPKPRNRGRVWLIVGLSVLALLVVAALLFFLLPRGGSPAPGSASPTATTTPTPTPSAVPSASPDPTAPVDTPPPVEDPSLPAFRDRVGVWLESALVGLDIVSEGDGDVNSVLDTMQGDAQRLSEALPPSSIAEDWNTTTSEYSSRLSALRSAVSSGSNVGQAVDAARVSVDQLRSLAGL